MNDDFVAAAAEVAEWIASYRGAIEELPVLSRVRPGDVAAALPASPPEEPEPLGDLLADLDRTIVPGLTHWNHPGFMAYFSSSASDPGILAEFVTAAINVNAMLWRSSPAATELEERMVDWTREFVGLPPGFGGVIQDTASTSSLVALLAARHHALPNVRAAGLAAESGAGGPRVYVSEHAHSSLDKAVIAAGIGHGNLVRIPADADYRMRPDALAAALDADALAGSTPVMVCATIGTTSCTSVDPVDEIADICVAGRRGRRVWLHVDAAYAGPAASLPEMAPHFEGWARADSIVLNPHKWMSVPLDCSLLLGRDLDAFRSSLALTREYLTSDTDAPDLMDIGIALGRRFRALKMWFVFRRVGAAGLRDMIRRHCALAREFAERVDGDPRLERVAPVPFSTVCFRAIPPEDTPAGEAAFNHALMDAVNRDGRVFLSHTELDGRFVIRLAIGNVETDRSHVGAAWDSVDRALAGLGRAAG